ncbi:phosphatidylinositol-3,5-bisphosphate 5-phosphatase [Rhizophlyctis rosea]|uniref:Phosphatidylinositol-3,5-bisphosphate 5-phosphatase n=1 Tax=Rhizophlyctis rosea TaxID=64517 RepID=A0AAD5SJP3_9FUNG|nr:phosphatidylinositol-3,5-bisphosphate 5-phosphatase [Rhizophlyctis rosea]
MTGFVRFLEGYYIILITKRSAVALIGGHYIYHIDDTMLISIPGPNARMERKPDESRYLQIFSQVDLSKNFYFSYTYDITQTLQANMSVPPGRENFRYNEMFVWNYRLLKCGFDTLRSDWVLPIIYGFVDQSRISVFGHNLFVTLIARRSRFFAGARFMKRGSNDQGYVANDVETEQIVHDATTTSLYEPRGRYGNKPAYTSFVQHRGSIPLYWSQDAVGMAAKPPIELDVVDPFFSAAALHFDDMFKRYGAPIVVLNLIKTKEKTPREAVLLPEFTESVSYLNQFLPADKKIKYIAWDMARASKRYFKTMETLQKDYGLADLQAISDDQDVIGVLEDLAEEVLATTGFFHSGPEPYMNALRRSKVLGEDTEVNRILGRRQNGVVRTNCIDCLDRTNAAQFVIGKCALGYQLYSMGVISHPSVPFDSDAVNMLNVMFHDHGDTIALQYGGSHLVNTMETYRKISPWTSHSRDMIESIRRYYSNSFTDAEKQDAMNLFLGHFVPDDGLPHLWDLPTDYFLHNENPRRKRPKRSYVRWWTPDAFSKGSGEYNSLVKRSTLDDYFVEYYRPKIYTTFGRLFAFNMISTSTRMWKEDVVDPSPFTVRANLAHISQPTRPNPGPRDPRYLMIYSLNIGGVKRWLTLTNKETSGGAGAENGKGVGGEEGRDQSREKEASAPWWTTSALATRLLDPQVPHSELKEYKRYINQFKASTIRMLPMPSSETLSQDAEEAHSDYDVFADYVSRADGSMSTATISLGGEASPAEVETRDQAMYSAYVESVDPQKASVVWGTLGRTKADVPRYEAYAKWLSTGKFVSSRSKTAAKLARA